MIEPVDHPPLSDMLGVYLVADPDQCRRPVDDDVADAVAAGVRTVQLRAKNLTDLDFLALGRRLLAICRAHGTLFVINDRLDIALALQADGVHLGVSDIPVEIARRLGGEHLLIGFSPVTEEQVGCAAPAGADYIGVGPVFATASKADAYEPIGVTGVARLAALSPIPTVGIGGVTSATAGAVIGAGAEGVAVIGAVLRSDSARLAAAQLVSAVRVAKSSRK